MRGWRGLSVSIAVVASLCLTVAGAHAGTGNETLTATPSENLPDTGPTPVVLTGSGFEPGLVGAIQQCSTHGGCAQFDDAVVGPDGSFSMTVYVSYEIGVVLIGGEPVGGSGDFCYTSSTNLCELVFIPYTGDDAGLVLASAPITFAGHIKQEPVAVLTATPTSGTAPLTVQLDGSDSYDPDPDGTVSQYFWEFGDGTTEEGSPSGVTSHLYALPGQYTVTMTVTDTHGDSDTATQLLTVTSASNTPPNAFIYDSYPASAQVGEEVTFNFYGNDLEGGVDLVFRFEGEGGSSPFLGDESSTSATHVYTQPGSYTPDLFVTDEDGARTIYTGLHAIEVTEAEPTVPIPIVLDPLTAPVSGVWAWGNNANGELGNGGTANETLATRVSNLTSADAVAAGQNSSLALVSGQVWSWGYGGGTAPGTQRTPVQVNGLTGVDAIAAGGVHGLALVDGDVWTLGGQPAKVSGLTEVDAIAAGGVDRAGRPQARHDLALVDGAVWAWGSGDDGQLGNNSTASQPTPVRVAGLTDVTAIAAGANHSLALRSDGSVWAWGSDLHGQLGNGSTTTANQSAPVPVTGLTGVDAIAAGSDFSLAVIDGEVWTWGDNQYSQLGWGASDQATPGRVPGLVDAVAIDGGMTQSIALRSDGTVWQWGWGGGSGDGCWCRRGVHRVLDISSAGAIAAGGWHNVAAAVGSPTHSLAGSAVAPAGGTVTTDFGADGATADSPVEVAATTPDGGTVSFVTSRSSSPSDYSVGGSTIQIEAPDASVGNPLVLAFTLDVSVFPVTWDVIWAAVYRDGVAAASCVGAGASPDPCVASRSRLANGDVTIVVRTSHASEWAVVVPGPGVDAGGPYSVAEGSSVNLAGTASGGTAPYSFLWDPAPGLGDPSVAAPSFAGVDDGVFPLRLTAIDGVGLAGEDTGEVTVTNALPAIDPLSLPASAPVNDEVALQAVFSDAGSADTHTATVNWGDGTTQPMTVAEQNGAGTASKTHVYATAGVKTVTVTVTDDDGGQRQRQQTINVLYGCVGPTPAGAIVRGTGNDTINGTDGDDVIVDAGGSNTINGRGGNDVICSGSGNDKIDAGAGDDLVVDKGGSNTVNGAGGSDRLTTGSGNDVVDGGAGDDTIEAGAGNNTVASGAGDDQVTSGAGNDTIDSGPGNDTIDAGNGTNTVDTGDGNDRITTGSGNDKIGSGAGNDTIQAGNGNNVVSAGSGDDTITAGSGSDSVDGGGGFDRCSAGAGKNTIKNCEA